MNAPSAAELADDERDGIALIRCMLDGDTDGSFAIVDHCDRDGVLAYLASVACRLLVQGHGRDGAHEWLDDRLRELLA